MFNCELFSHNKFATPPIPRAGLNEREVPGSLDREAPKRLAQLRSVSHALGFNFAKAPIKNVKTDRKREVSS